MTDPATIATLSLQLLSKTTEALNALRERSQRSKDIDIKDQINTLYDNVIGLKEVVSRLLDENKTLHNRLEQQQHPPEEPKIRQVGDTNYYYTGDGGPFCQPCYDVDPKVKRLVALSPQQTTEWGSIRRNCPVCQTTFYEKQVSRPQGHLRRGIS
jgi:small-conductance mechanosensitive channel